MHEPVLEGDIVEWVTTGDEGEVIAVSGTTATVRFDRQVRDVPLEYLNVVG